MIIPSFIFKLLSEKKAFAHCDVPCGIYDPTAAQVAAATILKMVQKINELPQDPKQATLEVRNSFVRMVWTKEEHARKCKEELLILWTDYFKEEHLKKFPNLHETFWNGAKLCSKNKQSVDEKAAQELVEVVDKIAKIFEESKK